MSIAKTRAFGSAASSMSSRIASSFWKEQASETRSPNRLTISATSSGAESSSERAASAATSSWEVVVIASRMVPLRRSSFITATNPNYKVYGVSGDADHAQNCHRSSFFRPRTRGVRWLVVRRRGACGRQRRQRSAGRLFDSARGVREADRPLHVRPGRGRLVRPVVWQLRRAEPRRRGRPACRRRRLLARARHDAPRRRRGSSRPTGMPASTRGWSPTPSSSSSSARGIRRGSRHGTT